MKQRPVYKRRIARTFLYAFCCMLLLVILTGALLFRIAIRLALNNEVEKNQSMLDQAALMIDSGLFGIDSRMLALSYDENLRGISAMDSAYDNARTIIQAMQSKESIAQQSTVGLILRELIIYLRRPGIIFTGDGGTFLNARQFCQGFFRIESMTAEETFGLLTTRYRQNIIEGQHSIVFDEYSQNETATERCMLLIRPIFIDGYNRGNMIGVVSVKALRSIMIENAFNGNGAVAWIEDGNGAILASLPEGYSQPPDERGMLSTSVASARYSINYRVLTPLSSVYASILPTARTISIVIAAAFLVGLAFSLWLSRQFGQPLDNISGNLRTLFAAETRPGGVVAGTRELRFIDSSVRNLLKEQQVTNAYVNTQTSIVRRLFYEKLLNGYFLDDVQVASMMNQIGEPMFSCGACVILCQIYAEKSEISLSESGYAKSALDEVIASGMRSRHVSVDVSLDTIVLITESPADNMQAVMDSMVSVCEEMQKRLKAFPLLSMAFSVSRTTTSYCDIGTLYSQCRDAVRHPAAGGECTLANAAEAASHARCEFSLEDEARLINFAIMGGKQNVEQLLERIFEANFANETRAGLSKRLLVNQLMMTFIRIHERVNDPAFDDFFTGVPSLMRRLDSASPEEAFELLDEQYSAFCDLVKGRQVPKAQKFMREVQAFIDENYADPLLSLQSLAEHFGISDAYLSRAFKSALDINVMSYVEKVRIGHAIELLRTDATIESIAHNTGFESVYRFRNAFKRVEGQLPSRYRE